jgi:hypothetical protein
MQLVANVRNLSPVLRFPYLLVADSKFAEVLTSHGINPSGSKKLYSIPQYKIADVSLKQLRHYFWLNPSLLFANYFDTIDSSSVINALR